MKRRKTISRSCSSSDLEGAGEHQPFLGDGVALVFGDGRRASGVRRGSAQGRLELRQLCRRDARPPRRSSASLGVRPRRRVRRSRSFGSAPRRLVQRPRQTHRRAAVADVALHLAGDRGHGEGGELVAAVGVVALDRVEQTDRARLEQIVELGAGAAVAARERLDEREVELDEAVSRTRVAALAVGHQQATGGRFSSFPIALGRRCHPPWPPVG